jgi:hypothetical protein
MSEAKLRSARAFGAILQGTVLGVLLFLAVMKLVEMSAAGLVFRYQGF